MGNGRSAKSQLRPLLAEAKLTKMQSETHRGSRLKRSILAGPSTPVPSWKLYDNPFYRNNQQQMSLIASGNHHETKRSVAVSARKLAATLWELQPQHSPNPRSCHQLLQWTDAGNDKGSPCSVKSNSDEQAQRQEDGVSPCNGSSIGADSLMQSGAIPMDCPTTSEDLFRVYNRIKILEDEQNASVSLVQSLRTELDVARARVQQLELAQRASRKELEHLLKKVAEERALWRSREQERVRAAVETVTEELNGERKMRRKMEILNRKLTKQLSEAKLAVTKSLEELEKERKGREILEDVCDELAKEIGEDKAEVEELRRESAKVREEVEEERRMLQMAEVWREERVQMKLTDARFVLEDKNLALDKLRSELEGFLCSRAVSGSSDVAADMREAVLLRRAANSIRTQEIRELSCQPPTSSSASASGLPADGDAHSIEVNNAAFQRRPERHYLRNKPSHSPEKRISNNSLGSPELYGICITPRSNYSRVHIEDRRQEDEEEWDSVSEQGSNGEEGSSDSPQETEDGKEQTIDSHQDSEEQSGGEANETISQSQSDIEDNEGTAAMVSELESDSGQLRKEDSLARFLLRSNFGKGEFCKSVPNETNFPTPTRYSISSQESVAQNVYSPSKADLQRSPDIGNPHIARGIKGFIEWPRGIRRNSLKAKLLEAKIESQKAQLRQVLKQKHLKASLGQTQALN